MRVIPDGVARFLHDFTAHHLVADAATLWPTPEQRREAMAAALRDRLRTARTTAGRYTPAAAAAEIPRPLGVPTPVRRALTLETIPTTHRTNHSTTPRTA